MISVAVLQHIIKSSLSMPPWETGFTRLRGVGQVVCGVPTFGRGAGAAPNEGVELSWGLVYGWGESEDRQMVWCGVRRTLHQPIAFEREWSVEEKMSIYQSIYISTLTFNHKLWVVMEKRRLQIEVVEMQLPLKSGWGQL